MSDYRYQTLRSSETDESIASDLEKLNHKCKSRGRKVFLAASLLGLLILWSVYVLYKAGSYSSLRGHEDSYRGPQATNDHIWAYQDDFAADFSTCQLLRSKLSFPITPQHQATHSIAAVGKSEIFDNACLSYRERYGPYTDESLDLSYDSNVRLFQAPLDHLSGPVKPSNFTKSQWTSYLHERTLGINSLVLKDPRPHIPDWKALMDGCGSSHAPSPNIKKTAILIRLYEGYVLTHDEILNLRAILTEAVINRPLLGIHAYLLIELKTTKNALMSTRLQRTILEPMMPREFWGLAVFWSEDMVKALLPGIAPSVAATFGGMCVLPEQVFSYLHPEYDFIYHWEADVRFLGDYGTFFDAADIYARQEPLSPMLTKYQTWLVRGSAASEEAWRTDNDNHVGRGKDADLITFNTIMDVNGSGWRHVSTKANYGDDVPLRTSIVSTSRMSKGLLQAMSLVMLESNKSTRCEAWPATVALHSQLPPSSNQSFNTQLAQDMGDELPFKAVFFPHPVYFDEKHEPADLEKQLNRHDFLGHEEIMKHSTYYFYSNHTRDVYRRWRYGEGDDACRKPALLHPVKLVGYNINSTWEGTVV